MTHPTLETLFQSYGVEPQDVAWELNHLADLHNGVIPLVEAELVIRKQADLQKLYRTVAQFVDQYGPAEVFNAWYCAPGIPSMGETYHKCVTKLDEWEHQSKHRFELAS